MTTSKTNIMDGGFSKKTVRLKGKYKFKNVVKNTKKSEIKLMDAYESMDNKIKKYNKAYVNHLENIKILDDYLNFNGIETLFKTVILKDNFIDGNIDKKNPLLFNNYNIKGELLPSEMRKEHLLSQIRFIIGKSIPKSDQTFIKNVSISDISKKEFVLVIETINDTIDKKIISHINYIVNESKVKDVLHDTISYIKKKLKRSSTITNYNSSNNISLKLSKKRSHKNASNKMVKHNNNSNSLIKISNKKSRSRRSRNRKSNKISRKLSEYMTDFEKIKRDEKKKEEEKAKTQAQELKKINDKKGILGQDYQSPIQQGVQATPQKDEIDLKCRSYGTNKELCDANTPPCFFGKWGSCAKSTRIQQANPQQANPFSVQPQYKPDPIL